MDLSGRALRVNCHPVEYSARLLTPVQPTSLPTVRWARLAVGNADGPQPVGSNLALPLGPSIAYIYDLSRNAFVTNIVFPGSKSNTAYGIWQNGPTNYTICGGYSPLAVNNLTNQRCP